MSDGSSHFYSSDDGLRLHARMYGNGKRGIPVLCLPGITRNSRDFEDVAAWLSERHPVVCPDFRGRGLSARDPEWRNYHPRTYVGDVCRLLDDTGIDRAVFLGTSLGGLVSTILAAEHAGRVAGVILNDIGPEIGAAGLARIKDYIGRAEPVSSWNEAVSQARETYGMAWPGLSDDDWLRLVRRSYRENDAGVPELDMDPMIGEAARSVGTGLDDPWALFDALRDKPALVLHGEQSDILTDDIVARMQAALPSLVHVRVANRGHVPLLDEPECVAAIDTFLRRFED